MKEMIMKMLLLVIMRFMLSSEVCVCVCVRDFSSFSLTCSDVLIIVLF